MNNWIMSFVANVDGTGRYYVKWNKPDRLESRIMITRDWGGCGGRGGRHIETFKHYDVPKVN